MAPVPGIFCMLQCYNDPLPHQALFFTGNLPLKVKCKAQNKWRKPETLGPTIGFSILGALPDSSLPWSPAHFIRELAQVLINQLLEKLNSQLYS